MTTETNSKKQIYQIVESLPVEQLPDILRLIKEFLQPVKSESTARSAPIYQIHQNAVDTGIPDLAAQHDHYLYGNDKYDV